MEATTGAYPDYGGEIFAGGFDLSRSKSSPSDGKESAEMGARTGSM
jgi:hypothetical protein